VIGGQVANAGCHLYVILRTGGGEEWRSGEVEEEFAVRKKYRCGPGVYLVECSLAVLFTTKALRGMECCISNATREPGSSSKLKGEH